MLIEAARRLPTGHAVGVDLWSGKDQSGNRPEVTLANAAAAGVADRVDVHNIPSPGDRYRAVDEAMRVLRPGGQLLIADFWPMAGKYAAHIGQGTLRGLGPGYWYGGPWLGTTLLHAVKKG
ncbi:hypothetical protein [Streptomyces sp. NPDC048425]|uniref:hypothetical protein n=1 Tax=Streptomyces sp. NPDC048425 TaxID=3365548 RepID=UPI00371D6AEE